MIEVKGVHTFKQSLHKILPGILAVYVIFQLLLPGIEPTIFWGEAIALILFFATLSIPYQSIYQKRFINCVLIWIYFFPFYAIFSTFYFWPDDYVLKYLLRHLSYFYYALFFFGAYQWGPQIITLCVQFRYLITSVVFTSFVLRVVGGVAGPMMLGFLWQVWVAAKKERFVFWTGFFLIIINSLFNSTVGERETDKIIVTAMFFMPVLYLLRKWVFWKPPNYSMRVFYYLCLFALLGTFVWFMFYLQDLRYAMWGAGLQFNRMYDNNAFSAFGGSSGLWRLFFWAYLLNQFLEHPFGIGVGTPIFDKTLESFIVFPTKPDESYLVGAHNFVMTFLARFGFPFLILLFFMVRAFGGLLSAYFQKTGLNFLATPRQRLTCASFMAFLIALLEALSNVVVESPYTAGIFWFLTGLFIRICGDYIASKEI